MKFNVNSISIQLQFNEFQCHFNQLTAKHHGSCKASWILHTGIMHSSSSPRHLQVKWRSSFEVLLLSWVNALE